MKFKSVNLLLPILFSATLFLPMSTWADPNSPVPADPVKVGMILTLSGNFATAGADSKQGIEAAMRLAGPATRLVLLYGDSKNDPTAAISEFQRMADFDRVVGFYTHRGSIGMALNPLSKKSGLVLIGGVGNKDFAKQNEYAIQMWPKSDDEGNFVAEDFIKRGFKRPAVIYTEDDWTNAVTTTFRSKLSEAGITLVADKGELPGETDFKTLLLQLKALKSDAVFFNVLLPQIAPAVKQARELNLPGAYYSNFYVAKKEVFEAAGTATDGVRYVEMDTNLPALNKALNRDPSAGAPSLLIAGYLATLLMAQAAEAAPPHTDSAGFYSALIKQNEIRTPDRTYRIEDRCVRFPLVLNELHSGKPHPLR